MLALIRVSLLQALSGYSHQTPGITAHLFRIFSSPNFSTYHFFPLTARGSMAEISLMTNMRAGTQLRPQAM